MQILSVLEGVVMSRLLLDLLPELLEDIYSYCTITDLINVATCNREHNNATTPRIWNHVQLPFDVDIKSLSRPNLFRFVRKLAFCDKNDVISHPISEERVVDNYSTVFAHCDANKITSLTFNNFCCDRILQTAAETLNSLHELTVRKCDVITSQGWQAVTCFSRLNKLELFQCRISDAEIANIVESLDLRKLILNQCRDLTSDSLSSICSRLTSLVNLTVSCWQFKDGSVAFDRLSQMKSLRNLSINGYYHASNEDITLLRSLTFLRDLDLSCSSNFNDSGLSKLSDLEHLKNLNICDCNKVTDTGVSHIASMSSLRVVNMSGCWKLSDFGLEQMKEMENLRELNIGGCRFITDVGVSHLSNIQTLTKLNISGCFYVTDIGLAELSSLIQLRELSMGACCVTDLGVCQLLLLSKLQSLSISECHRVTDYGLSEIAKLTSLQKLNINGCINITFIGLVQLMELRLCELNVKHCGLSDESVEQFCQYSGMKELFGVDGSTNSRILTRNYRLWTKHYNRWVRNIAQEQS